VPPVASQSAESIETRRTPQRRTVLTLVVAAVLCIVLLLWVELWPFQRKSVVQNLEEASDSKLRLHAFYRTYFPFPGCVVEGLEFSHGSNASKPLITIEKLVIRGSYVGILSGHLARITAEHLHVFIPPFGSGATFHTTPSKITIDEIVANGAVLEFALREPDKQPLRFEIHEALLRDVGWKGPLSYRVKVRNPEPPGEIMASGNFGVWNLNDPGQTPVSGEYKFDQVDLSVYQGIAGMLSSEGKFGGTLAHIDIAGSTDTPDFEVQSGGHRLPLTTKFSAYVDATNGDTFLKHIDAYFGRTLVVAEGSIKGSPGGQSKTALIDLRVKNGHIEDILGLFVKAKRAPMSGSVTLQARTEIPPGERSFLERLKLQGGFGVGAGSFSARETQESVDKLSAGAAGEKDSPDPETVLTDLTGQVALEDGTASFSDLSFGVPGATSRVHGTYSLISHKIDLHGQLQVDTKISNTTSGAKAILLKMMDPFFKKRHKGEVLPVRISGTYEHPSFGLDLYDGDAQKVSAPIPSPLAPGRKPN
jgi:AsmA-like C-terminal region